MYVGVSYVIPYSRAPTFTQFCEKAGNPDCAEDQFQTPSSSDEVR